jgi:ubiquinone/menaquinone biosynthesis C-methylase UbiE
MLFHEPWFGADYYAKHKELGLDYLAFGNWQLQHAGKVKAICASMGQEHTKCVLDLGCACGSIAEGLRRVFKVPTYGIDPSEHMIGLGRKTFIGVDLRVGSGMDMRMFKDESFDLVHSMQVFEHLLPHCVSSVLFEVKRILKPTGLCLAYLDYPDAPGAKDDCTHTCLRDFEWWKNTASWCGLNVSGNCPLIITRR